MRKLVVWLIVVGLFVVNLASVQAEELTGEDVLDKVKEAIDAKSAEMTLSMVLYSEGGSKRERSLQVKTAGNEGDKALIRFTAPADVEGTGFLSQEKSGGEEEMYLYLPALGSVRRIAGSQKNGSFVGTDFSYNDLSILGGGNYSEDYEASIEEETEEEYLLEIVPTDEEIEYSYGRMWVQKSNWVPTKVEFYDKDEKLHKELTNEDIKQVNKYWTPHRMTMKDVQKGTKTVLHLEEVAYDVELDDRIFTTRNLRR
jgi:outer membrane lipoprotein-sorting protein